MTAGRASGPGAGREISLVAFTLLSQAAVGIVLGLFLLEAFAARGATPRIPARARLLVPGLMLPALLLSLLHLGTRPAAWRALANIRRSWLSREVLFAVLFAGTALWLGAFPEVDAGRPLRLLPLSLAMAAGGGLIVSMGRLYRLRTVPGWNSRLTPASFLISVLLLGALGFGVLVATGPARAASPQAAGVGSGTSGDLMKILIAAALALLAAQITVERMRVRLAGRGAGATTGSLGAERLLRLREVLAASGAILLIWAGLAGTRACVAAWMAALVLVVASEVVGRTLFYMAGARTGL